MPRKLSRNGFIELEVKNGDPRQTYAGLLWVAESKGYKHGWVSHKFRAIFGKWPRPQSKVEPVVPSRELREWLGIMKARYRAQKKREEDKVVVPLPMPPEGLPSFMSEEDWAVKL